MKERGNHLFAFIGFLVFVSLDMLVLTWYDKNIEQIFYPQEWEHVDAEELNPEMKSAMPCDQIEDIKIYTVDGQMLNADLQRFIYRTMSEYGIVQHYEIFLCEIYQESRFNAYAVNWNGGSYGYCQLKKAYFSEFCKKADLPPDTDLITDYYANLRCGIAFFASNLKKTNGNVDEAIKFYYNSGSDELNSIYLNDVKQWLPTIKPAF